MKNWLFPALTWQLWLPKVHSSLSVQFVSFASVEYPFSQVHAKVPGKLMHVCWQLCVRSKHSSISYFWVVLTEAIDPYWLMVWILQKLRWTTKCYQESKPLNPDLGRCILLEVLQDLDILLCTDMSKSHYYWCIQHHHDKYGFHQLGRIHQNLILSVIKSSAKSYKSFGDS